MINFAPSRIVIQYDIYLSTPFLSSPFFPPPLYLSTLFHLSPSLLIIATFCFNSSSFLSRWSTASWGNMDNETGYFWFFFVFFWFWVPSSRFALIHHPSFRDETLHPGGTWKTRRRPVGHRHNPTHTITNVDPEPIMHTCEIANCDSWSGSWLRPATKTLCVLSGAIRYQAQ